MGFGNFLRTNQRLLAPKQNKNTRQQREKKTIQTEYIYISRRMSCRLCRFDTDSSSSSTALDRPAANSPAPPFFFFFASRLFFVFCGRRRGERCSKDAYVCITAVVCMHGGIAASGRFFLADDVYHTKGILRCTQRLYIWSIPGTIYIQDEWTQVL